MSLVRVIDLSCDYRCAHNPSAPTAVRDFVEATGDSVERIVFSLRRSASPGHVGLARVDGGVYGFTFFGFPFGIFWIVSSFFVAKKIERVLGRQCLSNTIIHAHKLGFEGLVAYWLRGLCRGYVVSVRGSTDVKVIKWKRLSRWVYRRVFSRAGAVFWVSVWARSDLAKFGLSHRASAMDRDLPNFSPSTNPLCGETPARGGPLRLVSAFRLDVYKLKGLPNLIKAIKLCCQQGLDVSLDVVGAGRESSTRNIRRLIASHGLNERVALRGGMPRECLLGYFSKFDALVLPTKQETFGLVFVEALSQGVPIIFGRGAGIDGYVRDGFGALSVDPVCIESIAAAIRSLSVDRVRLRKEAVEFWNNEGRFSFSRDAIVNGYVDVLNEI